MEEERGGVSTSAAAVQLLHSKVKSLRDKLQARAARLAQEKSGEGAEDENPEEAKIRRSEPQQPSSASEPTAPGRGAATDPPNNHSSLTQQQRLSRVSREGGFQHAQTEAAAASSSDCCREGPPPPTAELNAEGAAAPTSSSDARAGRRNSGSGGEALPPLRSGGSAQRGEDEHAASSWAKEDAFGKSRGGSSGARNASSSAGRRGGLEFGNSSGASGSRSPLRASGEEAAAPPQSAAVERAARPSRRRVGAETQAGFDGQAAAASAASLSSASPHSRQALSPSAAAQRASPHGSRGKADSPPPHNGRPHRRHRPSLPAEEASRREARAASSANSSNSATASAAASSKAGAPPHVPPHVQHPQHQQQHSSWTGNGGAGGRDGEEPSLSHSRHRAAAAPPSESRRGSSHPQLHTHHQRRDRSSPERRGHCSSWEEDRRRDSSRSGREAHSSSRRKAPPPLQSDEGRREAAEEAAAPRDASDTRDKMGRTQRQQQQHSSGECELEEGEIEKTMSASVSSAELQPLPAAASAAAAAVWEAAQDEGAPAAVALAGTNRQDREAGSDAHRRQATSPRSSAESDGEEAMISPEPGADELLLTPDAAAGDSEGAGPPPSGGVGGLANCGDKAEGEAAAGKAHHPSEVDLNSRVYGPLVDSAAAAASASAGGVGTAASSERAFGEGAADSEGEEGGCDMVLDAAEPPPPVVAHPLLVGEDGEEEYEEGRGQASKVWASLVYGCRSVHTYKRLNKISEGTYGAVFRAMHNETNEIVALKQVKYHQRLWSEGFPITSLREISIMLELQHPNILNVRQVVVGSGQHHVFMVMEYIEHELKTIMDEKPEFSTAERKCILKQLLEALAYLHANFVFHRDVKPSNLLYSNRGILKVADFGMARKFGIPFSHKRYTKEVVTLWYRPPEILLGQSEYDDKCDVWAVGAIFGELLLRRPLFGGHGEIDTIAKIWKLCGTPSDETWPGYSDLPLVKSKALAKIPHCQPAWREIFPPPSKHLTMGNGGVLSDLGLDLLQRLLTPDPRQRISAAAALQHEYFRETPKPQPTELMPSFPDTNNQARRKRRRGHSADLNDQKHQDSFRFGARVDAEKFLCALDQKTRNQRKDTGKITKAK